MKNLNPPGEMAAGDSRIHHLIEEALLEDLGAGDITTDAIVLPELQGRGEILAKESGILAGLEYCPLVFSIVDPDVMFHSLMEDGSLIVPGQIIARIEGAVASILKAERTALNLLQRMSGIATLTRRFVDAVAGTRAKITDTRKTAPCLRVLDKRAVQIGGGVNHRFGLDDMVLIKNNHIAVAGGVGAAIEKCMSYLRQRRFSVRVEIEVRNMAELEEARKHDGIHRIMLDNFSIDNMWKAVEFINHVVEVEASGNVTLENVRAIADTGVDFISIGALTHSPKALDVSLSVAAR